MALTLNGTTGVSGINGSTSAPSIKGTDSNTGFSFGTDIIDASTGGTRRLRMNESGRFFIGTSSSAISAEILRVDQEQFSNYVCMFNRTTDTDGSFRNHVGFSKSGSIVGEIKCKNNATQYNTSSDYRLKENISDVTDGIAKVKLLQPRKFNFKNEKGNFYDGFIAHEIQEVIPDCTSGTKDQVNEEGEPVYQGVDYGRITPVLTAAIKDLIAKVETLETKVAALEAA
tara:strand:- start:2046 stop:2729 length:684 start_codon:yes stop_codon:yes gene_type:complete